MIKAPRRRYQSWAERAGASLNVHFHVLCLDGVYVETEAKDGTLRFEAAPAPSREELQETLQYVYARVIKWLARRGLFREADASNEAPSYMGRGRSESSCWPRISRSSADGAGEGAPGNKPHSNPRAADGAPEATGVSTSSGRMELKPICLAQSTAAASSVSGSRRFTPSPSRSGVGAVSSGLTLVPRTVRGVGDETSPGAPEPALAVSPSGQTVSRPVTSSTRWRAPVWYRNVPVTCRLSEIVEASKRWSLVKLAIAVPR